MPDPPALRRLQKTTIRVAEDRSPRRLSTG